MNYYTVTLKRVTEDTVAILAESSAKAVHLAKGNADLIFQDSISEVEVCDVGDLTEEQAAPLDLFRAYGPDHDELEFVDADDRAALRALNALEGVAP